MYEQKTMTLEEYQKERSQKMEQFRTLPFEERLQRTVKKMINIVRGRTGASEVYADMLLSLLPNSNHKVCISYWLYKSDKNDEETIFELMQKWNDSNDEHSVKWFYEKLVKPYIEELHESCNGYKN